MPFEQRWDVLLGAAAAAFGERGFDGTSMSDVAARAGVNRALLYEHVKTKEALFEAAVFRERELLVAYIAERYAATSELPVRDRVRSRFHVVLDYAALHPAAIRLLARPEANALLHDAGRSSAPDDLAALLAAELAASGRPHGRVADVLAAMIIGMVNELMAVGPHADWNTEAVVDLLTDFTMAGMAGVPVEVLERADRPRTDRRPEG